MAIEPPLSTTSNLLVQTHIPVQSFQSYTQNVSTCAPLSRQLQIVDGTGYRYPPDQFFKDTKARIIYQLGPAPTSPAQKHI